MGSASAFVSYSWDDDDHKEWVLSLAMRLRSDGVEAILDRWHTVPGDQLPQFMETAVRENDYVLIVCTPRYKDRSDKRVGGVGYEGDVMTAEVMTKRNNRKFIPILRQGSWEETAPSWLAGKCYVDLSASPYSEESYQDLLKTMLGTRPAPPPVKQAAGDETHPEEPHLIFATNIDPSPPKPSEQAAGWKRSWFIRLKVDNTGQAAARSCVGRLLESRDEQGNKLAGLEALDLYWARQDNPETHKSLDIQGYGDSAYLDIAQVKEGEDLLTLRVVVPRGHRLAVAPGATGRSQDLPPGTYYLRIGIYADNAHVDPTWFKVEWRSQYPPEGDSSVDSYPCRMEIEEPPFGQKRH